MPRPSTVLWPRAAARASRSVSQRIVDDVADGSAHRQRIERKIERGLARHARAGGVDQQRCVARGTRPIGFGFQFCLHERASAPSPKSAARSAWRLRMRISPAPIASSARYRGARSTARAQKHGRLSRRAHRSPVLAQGLRASPAASVLRPSMLPSRGRPADSPRPRPARPHRGRCASAKAASLCGTVTLTPAKPASLQALQRFVQIVRAESAAAHRRRRSCAPRANDRAGAATANGRRASRSRLRFCLSADAHVATMPMFAQRVKQRHQRQAQDSEIIPFDALEKLRAATLQPVAADACQKRLAFRAR